MEARVALAPPSGDAVPSAHERAAGGFVAVGPLPVTRSSEAAP